VVRQCHLHSGEEGFPVALAYTSQASGQRLRPYENRCQYCRPDPFFSSDRVHSVMCAGPFLSCHPCVRPGPTPESTGLSRMNSPMWSRRTRRLIRSSAFPDHDSVAHSDLLVERFPHFDGQRRSAREDGSSPSTARDSLAAHSSPDAPGLAGGSDSPMLESWVGSTTTSVSRLPRRTPSIG